MGQANENTRRGVGLRLSDSLSEPQPKSSVLNDSEGRSHLSKDITASTQKISKLKSELYPPNQATEQTEAIDLEGLGLATPMEQSSTLRNEGLPDDMLQTIDDLDIEEKFKQEMAAVNKPDPFRTISDIDQPMLQAIDSPMEILALTNNETAASLIPSTVSPTELTGELNSTSTTSENEDENSEVVFASDTHKRESELAVFDTGEYVRPAANEEASFSDDVPAVGGLFGPYRLLGRLAEGGMAEIFLAVLAKSPDSTPYVLKRIKSHRMQDLDSLRLFREEGKICLSLSHPNIVRYESFDRVNDTPYLVMELVDGMDLTGLSDRTSLSPRAIVEIALGVSRALGYAHSARNEDGQALKIVHRDVSPQNILIARNGDVKLADFGISRFEGRSFETGLGPKRGKISYMAPEQLHYAHALDGRADLFALGAVMTKLLIGESPIPHGPIIAGDVTERVRGRLLALHENLPVELVDLIVSLMAYEAENRPDSAQDVVAILESVASKLESEHSLFHYAHEYIVSSLPSSEVVIRNLLQAVKEAGSTDSEPLQDHISEETAYPNIGLMVKIAKTGETDLGAVTMARKEMANNGSEALSPDVWGNDRSSNQDQLSPLENSTSSGSVESSTNEVLTPSRPATRLRYIRWIGIMTIFALFSVLLFLLLGQ